MNRAALVGFSVLVSLVGVGCVCSTIEGAIKTGNVGDPSLLDAVCDLVAPSDGPTCHLVGANYPITVALLQATDNQCCGGNWDAGGRSVGRPNLSGQAQITSWFEANAPSK